MPGAEGQLMQNHAVSSSCQGAANKLLLFALLRFFLDQSFGQEDEPQKLRPLRHDVPHYLPPLSFGIHLQIEYCPARSRKPQKNGQRMIPNRLDDAASEVAIRLFALR